MSAIIYQVYYHAIKRLYNKQPISLLDYKLVQLAFQIVYHGYLKYFVLVILVTILIGFSMYRLCDHFVDLLYHYPYANYLIPIFIIIQLAGMLPLIHRRGINGHHYKRIFYLSYIVFTDIYQSYKVKNSLARIREEGLENYNSISKNIQLENAPNVYFLFVESYGKILYDLHNEEYKMLCTDIEKELLQEGWKIKSNLSKAPRMGGGSWMCYASLLYGTLIQDESFFRLIMNENENIESNISILHALKSTGYQNHLLNPLTGFQDMQINWEDIRNFFAADEIFKFSDMEYTGNLVGAIGRQPPDQYSLNKTYEAIKNKKGPFTLFFETLNSHATWTSPTQVEKDWKKLNDIKYQYPVCQKKYWPAIKYQISFLSDFIKNKLNDDSIVILIGDHQPPLITNAKSGYETPVHIISKDAEFLETLNEYHFEDGLQVEEREKNNVTHPGMYYILLRSLIKRFGKKNADLIPYLKNGILLNQLNKK